MCRFAVKFLREASHAALWATTGLAQAYQPLALTMFLSLVCFWAELNARCRAYLVHGLVIVIRADMSFMTL